MNTSKRLGRVAPSPTLTISAKAKALKRQGRDIIAFGAGEPDFDTPEDIKDAARDALTAGKTKYSPPAGEVELREHIAGKFKSKWDLHYDIDQVLVSNGAKHSLYNLFSALLNDGDEVIVPSPYWVSYPAQVMIAGGNPVVVEGKADRSFCPTVEQLDAACTDRTRAIVLNSPSNPTGGVWTRKQLEDIADWLLTKPGVLAIYDGIYESLVYDGAEYVEFAALRPGLKDRVVCINGVSKSVAMTGWRIGWALGPKPLLKAMSKLQGQSTSGPNTIAQWAAIAAINIDPEIVESMRKSYDGRRLLACSMLEDIPHVKLRRPLGAFYAFPDLSAYIGGRTKTGVLTDDLALAGYLLEQAGVALVPGSAFGAPGYARITYACSENDIQHGITRIEEALDRVILA